MLRIARISALFIALILALAGGGIASAQTLLRWKFEPGQVHHLSMVQEMKQTIKSGETPPMAMDMTNTMDMTWKVESVDSRQVATLAQTIDRVRMKMQGAPGMAIDYDSASKTEPEGAGKMAASMMKAFVGAGFVVKMTARGDVVGVKLPAAMELLKKTMAAGGMAEMLSPEGIKKMSGLGVLPEKPVKLGDSWTNTAEMKLPFIGTIAMEHKHTYLGPIQRDGRELEKIGVATRTKPPAKKDEGPAGALQMDGGGTTYFDNRAGRLVENEATMKIKMDMSVMGQKMAMTTQTTAKTQVSVAKAKSPPK